MAVCQEHSGVCANMENLIKQTDTNTHDIKTLSDAVVKLTILVEDCNKRMEAAATVSSVKPTFWDSETKKYAIKFAFILCVILILTLAGTNILEQTTLPNLLK
jgi:hypothetical protein